MINYTRTKKPLSGIMSCNPLAFKLGCSTLDPYPLAYQIVRNRGADIDACMQGLAHLPEELLILDFPTTVAHGAMRVNFNERVVEWLIEKHGAFFAGAIDTFDRSVLSCALYEGKMAAKTLTHAEYLLSLRDDWKLPDGYILLLEYLYGTNDFEKTGFIPEIKGMHVNEVKCVINGLKTNPALNEVVKKWWERKKK